MIQLSIGGYALLWLTLVPSFARAQVAVPAKADVVLEKVDFRALPLGDACRLLSDQTGLNIVPSEEASQQVVSLYLRGLNGLAVIEAICKAHQLWFQKDATSGIIRISTTKEYNRNLSSLQDERTEFFSLLYPNAMDVGYAIRNLFGDRVELRRGDDTDNDIVNDLQERLQRFDLINSRTQGLGGLGGVGGTSNYGSGLGVGGDLGGGIGIGLNYLNSSNQRGYDSPNEGGLQSQVQSEPKVDLNSEEILELERIVSDPNTSPEARAHLYGVLSRRARANIYVTVASRQNKLVVRTADDHALGQIREIVQKLDVPTALVLLEVRILAVDLLDGMNSFFEYQYADGNLAGEFTQGSIQNPVGGVLGPAGTGLQSGNLIFQFVDATFGARMQVLERENRVRAISTPVLLTANNEVSRLFVGREVPLNRSFSGGQIVANDSTTATVPGSTTIEFRPVGVTLLITPNINADRTVTLRIVQESSDVDSTATVLVPDEEGFSQQTVNVVSSQSVSGTIVAKSDLAVVFGGLIEQGVKDQKEQVPILGDIPLLGVLFQRKTKEKIRREIIVVVRPYVLSTPAESEASSRKLLDLLDTDPTEFKLSPQSEFKNGGANAPPAFKFHGVGGGG
jgi:general secretion pathway protein D